jgi:hypothetical protein
MVFWLRFVMVLKAGGSREGVGLFAEGGVLDVVEVV